MSIIGRLNALNAVCILLLSLCHAGSAHAESVIEESTEYFDVDGQFPSEILAAISAVRGSNVVALTKTSHEMRYSVVSRGDRCRVEDTVINTKIVYLVPRWTGYNSARKAMKDAWDKFHEAIMLHEHGHGDLAKAASRDLSRSIGRTKGHCSAIETLVDGRRNLVVSRYELRNEDYDTRTMHGQKQGIVFPDVLE